MAKRKAAETRQQRSARVTFGTGVDVWRTPTTVAFRDRDGACAGSLEVRGAGVRAFTGTGGLIGEWTPDQFFALLSGAAR
ncbi:MAG TPA: hypothetical protein VMZ50_08340 [Phycisphaerae bacterium]|nr:hypothetical protein [Phycisphaerae bacterium]